MRLSQRDFGKATGGDLMALFGGGGLFDDFQDWYGVEMNYPNPGSDTLVQHWGVAPELGVIRDIDHSA